MPEPDNTIQPQNSEAGNPEPEADAPAEEAPVDKEVSMDIHPIHGPVLTLREFFTHLLIITLGILIALSLEGLLEWQHHRSLLREARENISTEIERNKKAVAADLEKLHTTETQLQEIVSTIQKMESDHTIKVDQLRFGGGFSTLSFTSWNTANRSGAIGYMPYDEVEKYTEIYDTQQSVLTVEYQALPIFTQLAGQMQSVLRPDPKHRAENDLKELEGIANRAVVFIAILESAEQELSNDYAKVR